MNRQEYIELVNDWNNFLLKEEKRILNEHLIIESILINENKLKSLAKKLKVQVVPLTIALTAMLGSTSISDAAPPKTSQANLASAEVIKDRLEGQGSKDVSVGYDASGNLLSFEKTGSGGPELKKTKVTVTHDIVRKSKAEVLKIIGKELVELKKSQDGIFKKAKIQTASYVYSDVVSKYKIHVAFNRKDAAEKIHDQMTWFKPGISRTIFSQEDFDQKIQNFKSKHGKDILYAQKLASIASVYHLCLVMEHKCVESLKTLEKGAQTVVAGRKIQASLRTKDGRSAYVNKTIDEQKVIFDKIVDKFDDIRENYLNTLTSENPVFDSNQSKILNFLLVHQGDIWWARVRTMASGAKAFDGEDTTQLDGDITMGTKARSNEEGISEKELENMAQQFEEELDNEDYDSEDK